MNRAAFFDIDGTLISDYSQKILVNLMSDEKYISNQQRVYLYICFFLMRAGFLHNTTKIREAAYSVFCKYEKKIIDDFFYQTSICISKYYKKNWMFECIAKHKDRGFRIIGITASLKKICLYTSIEFGIHDFYGTELSVENGKYNGKWKGQILEGSHKVDLMMSLKEKLNLDMSESYAYADSLSDLPMLESVGHPVAVCPDSRLKKYALKHNWTILEDPK